MDVRPINTKNRILNGLIKVLSTQKLSECRTIDIINQAEVSKKTFYNYFKNKKDFIHWVETNILTSLKNALQKDRASLEDTHNASEQKIMELANSAFNVTLKYCDDHKDTLAVLLSDNGDINLYHAIINLANDEFLERAPYLFNTTRAEIQKIPLYKFFQTLYVDSIIRLLLFWLNHRSTMSIDDGKYLAGLIQTKSNIQLMKSLAN